MDAFVTRKRKFPDSTESEDSESVELQVNKADQLPVTSRAAPDSESDDQKKSKLSTKSLEEENYAKLLSGVSVSNLKWKKIPGKFSRFNYHIKNLNITRDVLILNNNNNDKMIICRFIV